MIIDACSVDTEKGAIIMITDELKDNQKITNKKFIPTNQPFHTYGHPSVHSIHPTFCYVGRLIYLYA